MFSFNYDADIANKLSQIAALQAQISLGPMGLSHHEDLLFKANVEAVHFSTKIEGNQLTLQQVTEALRKGKISKPNRSFKEILNYSKARAYLTQYSRSSLSHEMINRLHDILLHGIVIKGHRGKYRGGQNVIKDARSRVIVYMPPEASDVHSLISQLIKKVKALLISDNAIIAAAFFHFGFATIHPYMDGNGRTARLISSFLLQQGGYSLNQFAALEKQHEKDRKNYYQQLHQLQGTHFYEIPENLNITSWIHYFLECTLEAYIEASKRLSQLPVFEGPDLDDRLAIAYSLFKKFKKIRTRDYESLAHVGRTQAVKDLNQLIQKGLIEKVGGGRSTVYKLKTI